MRRPYKAAVMGGSFGQQAKAVGLSDLDEFLDWLVDKDGSGTDPQDLYKAVAYTFWCTRYRANNIASLPYYVFPMELEEDDEDQKVEWGIDLRPLLWIVEAWLTLKGAAYMLKVLNRRTISDLILLNANTMKVKTWDKWGKATSFEQRVGQEHRTFQAEEIVYFRTFDPHDDIREGVASGQAAQIPGSLIWHANTWASAFFENGAIPAVLLTTQEAVPPVEKERVQSAWQKMFQGVQRSFKTAVLERGLTPTVIGQPIKDLAMPDLEQTKRLQILAAHDLPPGLAEPKTNRAERDALQLAAWQDHLEPYIETFIEPALNKQLFNPLNLRLSFQYSLLEVYQAKELEKGEKAAFFVSGVMLPAYEKNTVSLDEVRAVIDSVITAAGLPPLADTFEPREVPPQLQAAAEQAEQEQGGDEEPIEGAPAPMDERIESRLPKSAPPKVSAPRWGRHQASLRN